MIIQLTVWSKLGVVGVEEMGEQGKQGKRGKQGKQGRFELFHDFCQAVLVRAGFVQTLSLNPPLQPIPSKDSTYTGTILPIRLPC
jgi:hypothetical protein